MSREVQVTIDCADPRRLGAFWETALGYEPDPPPEGFATWDEALEAWGVPEEGRNAAWALHDPDGRGPRVFLQRVPEGKTTKNRVHLDVRAAPDLRGAERMTALETECQRLLGHGATRGERVEPGGMNAGHIVMHDPEGNEFCLD